MDIWHRRAALSALMIGMLLAALEQTVVATALPTIAGALGDNRYFPWVVTAYLLATSVTMPLYGKLGDMLGRKPGYLAAIALFVAGSVLSGMAEGIGQLVAFRVVQGLGGGGLIVGAQTMVADLVSPRQLGRYHAYMGGVFGAASIVGPIVGGYITDSISWRWLFLGNVPLGAVALAMGVLALPRARPTLTAWSDYWGAALLGVTIVCATLVAGWAGSTYAWDSPVILGLLSVAAVLGIVFVLVERSAPVPLVPLRILGIRTYTLCLAISVIEGFAMFGAVTFLPTFLQLASEASVTTSGLLLAPMTGGLLVAARVAAAVIARSGQYVWSTRLGTALIALAFFLLSMMNTTTGLLAVTSYLVLLGVGLGMAMPIVVVAAQSSVARCDVGSATSALTLGRSVGGLFGVSVFGVVFSARLAVAVTRGMPPGHTVLGSTQVAALPAAARDALGAAAARGIGDVFQLALPPLLIGIVLAFCMPRVRLRDGDD